MAVMIVKVRSEDLAYKFATKTDLLGCIIR